MKFIKQKFLPDEDAKRKRFFSQTKSSLKTLWRLMTKEAGMILFQTIWVCPDLTKLEFKETGLKKRIVHTITSKYKNQMLGYKYQLIYQHLNILILNITDKQLNKENFVVLQRELRDFYSRPITEQHKKDYPIFRVALEEIFAKVNANYFKFEDAQYLKNIILKDIEACELFQKTRFMKEFGLLD